MRKLKRNKENDEEKDFLLARFTTLLSLITKYLHDQTLPNAWGLGDQKNASKKELRIFLKKYGMIKTLKKRTWKI